MLSWAAAAFAQERLADSLHRSCNFPEAIEIYDSLLASSADSLERERLQTKLLCSENASVMSGFVNEPVVVAKHLFSREDFFLYYPLEDRSWRPLPNLLDSLPDTYVKATWMPEGAEEI